MLPVDAPDGDTRTPRQLVYSSKRAAWLIFFESQAAGGVAASGGGANGAAAAAPERFTWTYVTAAALSVGGSEGGAGPQSWVRAGAAGRAGCVQAAAAGVPCVYDSSKPSCWAPDL